ncbi:N,N-dimethylformamidase beta subunit family domain-containing protein [Micromonospora coerulea]|uniref:N,N-dimethylformamidase beta subunit family domain-containing protein n=1 Tax=Micromonospora coerulea TaxID=47856 RepID=UPI001907A32B|nr:N,N-dimethylformamidase beta subunit family domain-containing protein [Micromonospora veneta]
MVRLRRRWALGLLAGGVSAAALGTTDPVLGRRRTGTLARRQPPPVEVENRAAGEPWWPPRDDRCVDDRQRQIQGYASTTSVAPGESVDFHVAVNPGGRYRISIHRLGWYDGAGARTLLTSPQLDGEPQPVPPADPATGAIACRWPVSWTVRVPDDWTSGLYQAVFTSADGWRACTPFVVRDDRRAAALCVVLPMTTWQAYNQWPLDGQTGKSLYNGFSATGRTDPAARAREVSFDRPYVHEGLPTQIDRDHDAIQWLERSGYDVSYASSLDLHSGRLDPSRHRGLVFSGHDEYWSVRMRRAAERAVAAGTSLAFLSANSVYWHVRIRDDADGRPGRLVACSKATPDPEQDADGPTITWRNLGRPEQALLGVQYNGIVRDPQPLVVRAADHWFWAGTGLADGDRIPGMVGGEADGVSPDHPYPTALTATVLSASPYRTRYGSHRVQNTHLYETPQGGLVFASGTFCWAMALNRPGHRDERVVRATANLLDRITGRDAASTDRAAAAGVARR